MISIGSHVSYLYQSQIIRAPTHILLALSFVHICYLVSSYFQLSTSYKSSLLIILIISWYSMLNCLRWIIQKNNHPWWSFPWLLHLFWFNFRFGLSWSVVISCQWYIYEYIIIILCCGLLYTPTHSHHELLDHFCRSSWVAIFNFIRSIHMFYSCMIKVASDNQWCWVKLVSKLPMHAQRVQEGMGQTNVIRRTCVFCMFIVWC